MVAISKLERSFCSSIASDTVEISLKSLVSSANDASSELLTEFERLSAKKINSSGPRIDP